MSLPLDTCDERLMGRYPRYLTISEGAKLTVTPMVPSDWECLERFVHATPESERQFFRRDLPDSERVERWCAELDYRHVLPLLAWDGDRIVSDATLLLDPDLWTGHVGKLRLTVHPEYRGRGLARAMLREVGEVAHDVGLHKLVHECGSPQEGLIDFLRREGFEEVVRLTGFVRDRDGTLHDMVMLVRDV